MASLEDAAKMLERYAIRLNEAGDGCGSDHFHHAAAKVRRLDVDVPLRDPWRPLYEADPDAHECLRRVVMAGYRYEAGARHSHVGEAFYGAPDGRAPRWIWSDGGDVIDPLGFQDLPGFPIGKQDDGYCSGKRPRAA